MPQSSRSRSLMAEPASSEPFAARRSPRSSPWRRGARPSVEARAGRAGACAERAVRGRAVRSRPSLWLEEPLVSGALRRRSCSASRSRVALPGAAGARARATSLSPAPEAPAPSLRSPPVEVEHVVPLVDSTPEPSRFSRDDASSSRAARLLPSRLSPSPSVRLCPEPASRSRSEEPGSRRRPSAASRTSPLTSSRRPEQELPLALSYDVSLRLTDGERVPVGSFGEPEKAREYAREVVGHLSDEADGWPFFSGRFMRPDTIVSVDIVPVGEPDRWLGSARCGPTGLPG